MFGPRALMGLALGCIVTSLAAFLYVRNEEPEHSADAGPETLQLQLPRPLADQRTAEPEDPSERILARYEGLASGSIKRAFASLQDETSGTQTPTLRKLLAQRLVNSDFERLTEVLTCLPPGAEREFLLSVVLPRAIDRDMSGTLTVIESLGTMFRAQAYRHAVDALLEKENFADAAQVLARMPPSEHRTRSLEAYGTAIAGKDDAAFSSFLETLSRDETQGVVKSTVLTFRTQKNSAGLQRLLPLVTDPFIKHLAIRGIVTAALDRGERANLSSVLSELSAPDRELAEAFLLVENETVPFQEAMNQALDFKDPSARETAVAELVKRKLEEDPVVAGEEVLKVPDSGREQAIRSLVSTWYGTDRIQATHWVQQLPTGANRDIALEQLIPSLRRDDPTAAADAAGLASTAADRERFLRLLSDPS